MYLIVLFYFDLLINRCKLINIFIGILPCKIMPNKRFRDAIRQIKLDMRAMIKGYQEQKQRYPTNDDMRDVFQSTDKTTLRFKNETNEEERKTRTELIGFEKVDKVRQGILGLKSNISY